MAKIEVEVLKSINSVKFGASSDTIHKILGNDFNKGETEENPLDNQEYLLAVCKKMSEMTGRPVEEFKKYIESNKNELGASDSSDKSDYYKFCRIDYTNSNKFEAIEIYSNCDTELIINGTDYSDFDLKKLLTLSNDFKSEENGTSYISYSKQIGIWCPDSDNKVESILFGRPGYYLC